VFVKNKEKGELRGELGNKTEKKEDGTRIIILITSISSYRTEKCVISNPHYPMAGNLSHYR
jgi:hypothetical protein